MDVIIKDGDNSVKLQSVDAGSSVRIIDQNGVEGTCGFIGKSGCPI